MKRKVAFYYHIPVLIKNNKLFIPSFLGVFIDSLALNVEFLYLIMHVGCEEKEADYMLKSNNIILISLGPKTPAWHRMIFHKKILFAKLKEISEVEYLIIRSPSPLAPFFSSCFNPQKIVFMVVGDYSEGRKQMKKNTIRSVLISGLLKWNDYLFVKEMKRTPILVNSPALYKKYEPFAFKISQIKTTTLSINDFYQRIDTCQGEKIRLLYTGRIDLAKGLVELVLALAELNKAELKFTLDIVGWEGQKNQPVRKHLIEIANKNGQLNQLTFHDKMSVGVELNKMYRKSDIYVIPSYHEGFPRTIWESMANCCPVIATNVGSIPYFLEQKVDALIIEPKDISQIVNSVLEIVSNDKLRKSLIKNGFELAKKNTLESQTIELLNKVLN
jgi:glycosyltransferase involved in cell wall biosynthesis